jgi:hypothetical protein
MTRKQAIKKTILKFTCIKNNLNEDRNGRDEIDEFNVAYPEYLKYIDQCPLCELFRAGNRRDSDCPKCILNVDNCFNEPGRFQNFLIEKSIPEKRKFCNWVIKKCKKALEAL